MKGARLVNSGTLHQEAEENEEDQNSAQRNEVDAQSDAFLATTCSHHGREHRQGRCALVVQTANLNALVSSRQLCRVERHNPLESLKGREATLHSFVGGFRPRTVPIRNSTLAMEPD